MHSVLGPPFYTSGGASAPLSPLPTPLVGCLLFACYLVVLDWGWGQVAAHPHISSHSCHSRILCCTTKGLIVSSHWLWLMRGFLKNNTLHHAVISSCCIPGLYVVPWLWPWHLLFTSIKFDLDNISTVKLQLIVWIYVNDFFAPHNASWGNECCGLGRFRYMTLSLHGGVLLWYLATSVHTMTTSVHNFRRYHFGTFYSTISVHCIRPLRYISNM